MKLQQRWLVRALLLPVLLGLLILGQGVMAAEPQQQAQFANPRLVVNSSFLNVRTGPGIQYTVAVTVVGGTELPVIARAKDNVWFQVATVVGVGWVNIQYTIPRGSFDYVPIINTSDIGVVVQLPQQPSSLALPSVYGQGGGSVPVPVITSAGAVAASPSAGNPIRFNFDSNQRVTSVRPGERFRVVLNVEAVNIRTQPDVNAKSLGTLFLDRSNDYTLVNSAKDASGNVWFLIDVPDVATGWIEGAKVQMRLSRLAGQVIYTAHEMSLLDAPGGSGQNMPFLATGQEGFIVSVSKDGKFVEIELIGGERGWIPFDTAITRTGTPTDKIDLSTIPAISQQSVVVNPANPVTNPSVIVSDAGGGFPQAFGLETPHVVINTGFLNIRSGPGAQYSVVATVPGGTELPVLGVADDYVWYLVQGVFGRGWVNGEFALFRGSIDSVPVIKDFTGTVSMPVAVVAASAVTLYAAPGTNFGTVGSLPGPTEVPIVARTMDSQWIQVNTAAGYAWVVASQIIIRGDLNLVPIVG